jgi:hypothetical protein
MLFLFQPLEEMTKLFLCQSEIGFTLGATYAPELSEQLKQQINFSTDALIHLRDIQTEKWKLGINSTHLDNPERVPGLGKKVSL